MCRDYAQLYYKVEFENGEVWAVPLWSLVNHRANAIVESDGTPYHIAYTDTVKLFMSDYEYIHNYKQSVEWDDISRYAKKLQSATNFDYNEAWRNAERYVVE